MIWCKDVWDKSCESVWYEYVKDLHRISKGIRKIKYAWFRWFATAPLLTIQEKTWNFGEMEKKIFVYYGRWGSGYKLDSIWIDEDAKLRRWKYHYDLRWLSEYLWMEMSFDGEFFECKKVLAWYADV